MQNINDPIYELVCSATIIKNDAALSAKSCFVNAQVGTHGGYFIVLFKDRFGGDMILGYETLQHGTVFNEIVVVRFENPSVNNFDSGADNFATSFPGVNRGWLYDGSLIRFFGYDTTKERERSGRLNVVVLLSCCTIAFLYRQGCSI